MKHKTGMTLALVLALALLVGLLSGITAYAGTGSESFDTTTWQLLQRPFPCSSYSFAEPLQARKL